MKKTTFLLMIIVLSFVSAFGQNAAENNSLCTNQTVEKISSRGISLGMTQQETINLFVEGGKLTQVSETYSQNEGRKYLRAEVDFQRIGEFLQSQSARNFGFSITSLAPKDKLKFDGISHYDLGFLDNRLAFFGVYYTKPKWESSEQYVRRMSEILALPVQENSLNNTPYSIKCGIYSVRLYLGISDEGQYYIMEVSADINETTRARRKKADDEQREKDIKAFKP